MIVKRELLIGFIGFMLFSSSVITTVYSGLLLSYGKEYIFLFNFVNITSIIVSTLGFFIFILSSIIALVKLLKK